jgi:hypothetical protein
MINMERGNGVLKETAKPREWEIIGLSYFEGRGSQGTLIITDDRA